MALYPLLLMLSGVLLIILGAAVGGQSTGQRVFNVIFGILFFGYGFYLEFLFGGGTVLVFWYAFIVPIVMVWRVIKARREARESGMGMPGQGDQPAFGATQAQPGHGAPQAYPDAQGYGVPQPGYGPPPAQGYGAPRPGYGPPPAQGYGAPQPGYGPPPAQGYGAGGAQGYGSPQGYRPHDNQAYGVQAPQAPGGQGQAYGMPPGHGAAPARPEYPQHN